MSRPYRTGSGGEIHQTAGGETPTLTTEQGIPVFFIQDAARFPDPIHAAKPEPDRRFGVHTLHLVSAEGRSTFVKFHWKPQGGLRSVVWNEALKMSGADPDFHRRDLCFRTFESSEVGSKPRIRSETFADHYSQARQLYVSQTEVERRHIA